jgi:hypothetical protein
MPSGPLKDVGNGPSPLIRASVNRMFPPVRPPKKSDIEAYVLYIGKRRNNIIHYDTAKVE